MKTNEIATLGFDIIEFDETEIGIFDLAAMVEDTNNGSAILCCFSVHFHKDNS